MPNVPAPWSTNHGIATVPPPAAVVFKTRISEGHRRQLAIEFLSLLSSLNDVVRLLSTGGNHDNPGQDPGVQP